MIRFFNYGESMSISHNACEEAQERQKLERGASQVAPGVHARVRVGALGLHLAIQLLVSNAFHVCSFRKRCLKNVLHVFHSGRGIFHLSRQCLKKRF